MAAGSQATWEGMPRVCTGCDIALRMSKDTLWLDTMRHQSWHHACKLEQLRKAA